jgi:ubiquinone/menaquinone biosynthesis C-methylase UbiE
MVMALEHDLKPALTPDEIARSRFVSGLRSVILNEMAGDLRHAFEARAEPAFRAAHGRAPADSDEVHAAIRDDAAFKVYSACRVEAQRMVWSSVIPSVEREREPLERRAEAAIASGGSTVELDPALPVPRNVAALDVHLMPGAYAGTVGGDRLGPGAVYDRGLAVFSMGLMGRNLDDIGLSMSAYVRNRFPDFAPSAILDVGCTIGHNTLPWKQTYPDADVHAVDVAAPGLVYAAARANLQGRAVHFHQMNAESLAFDDASFDLVFTSMFLHELSAKTRAAFFKEAHRVLRPGGLLLNMELPPNREVSAFDGFYLDWDCWYNEEPFYKGFRDEDPRALCRAAGFADSDYLQFVTPSMGIYGADAIAEAATADPLAVDRETTGRLAAGVRWFGFGAWKAAA